MQKIMFNDRYGLTQAVIEGRKTMTRRIELRGSEQNIFRYKLGEIVAVAQSYQRIGISREYIDNDPFGGLDKGWGNKMFVRSDMMPHQIRIIGIKCERLQDISNEDCIKEGVCGEGIGFFVPGIKCKDWRKESHVDTEDGMTWKLFPTRRQAFAALIDKVSGRGTWASNPWVVVYEFELLK